ncbi:MAG TPA: peptide ABC transporter substrate-binding protein [bacterium]|jgi:peptide/nickel transport system substrate-binding protein
MIGTLLANRYRLYTMTWLLLVVLVSSTVAAGTPPSQPVPAGGTDQVVIGMAQEPGTLSPLFAEMAASFSIIGTLFTADVQRDNLWRAFPQGAASLPNLKDGTWRVIGNAMTLTWKIRPRRWHDGRPVGCGDYVFGDQVARDERVPVITRDLTNRVLNVTCPGGPRGTEITVNWKERYAYANLTVTEHGPLPRHVLEPFYRANPGRLNEMPFGNDPKFTIGDGAYRIVEWQKGSTLTVQAVPNHLIFGSPRIRRIVWRFIPDTSALVTYMLAGTIDAISTIGISFDQAVQLQRLGAGRFHVFFEPGLIWEHVDFNLDNPLLADVRVRRAIAYAINREQISQQLFGGRQPVSNTYLPGRHPGYTERVEKYPFNPGRARALLERAGFSPGRDGIYRDSGGRRLSLELNTVAGNRIREQVAQIIQKVLREVGIEIKIVNYPARVLLGEMTGHRQFTGLAMYAWVLSPTSDCDSIYTSDGIPTAANAWTGQNYPGYRNTEMDRVCKAASREIDESRRNAYLRESAAIFSRDLPALPLYVRAQVAAAKAGLHNFVAVQLTGTYETWNVHRWFWE